MFVGSYDRSTSKRPAPAPSLHWMRRLVLLNGIREPRKHWWLARTQAMLMRARTIPQTTEYGRSQRFTKCLDNCLSRFLASKPKRPSVEITNGVKERRCWRHSSIYFFFFCCSWLARTLAGSLVTYDAASRSVTRTSIMQSLPFFQRLRHII